MASNLQLRHKLSVEEYLQGELMAELRHEYIDGEVYAMSGGTRNHNRIALNIGSYLSDCFENSPCSPFINDVKVRVQSLESDAFYYPDVVVTCDPEDTHELYVEKPSVIFEVLSDSTERIDRQEKFFAYRSIDSLDEYVLVSQKSREVLVARRANNWQVESYAGDDFELQLNCLDSPLTSERIYRKLQFED